MLPGPGDLQRALAARGHRDHPALPGRRNHLRAGVCVPLHFREGGADAWLTLRPRTLRRHGGEVSFPGGRREPGDADLEATARREAFEEIGLRRLTVLGRLHSMPVYTSEFRLEPFVVAVDPSEPVRLDPVEVERVLHLDLGQVLAADAIEGLATRHGGADVLLPIFDVEGAVVFGATALTLWELLGVMADLAGRPLPEVVPTTLAWEDLMSRKARARAS